MDKARLKAERTAKEDGRMQLLWKEAVEIGKDFPYNKDMNKRKGGF